MSLPTVFYARRDRHAIAAGGVKVPLLVRKARHAQLLTERERARNADVPRRLCLLLGSPPPADDGVLVVNVRVDVIDESVVATAAAAATATSRGNKSAAADLAASDGDVVAADAVPEQDRAAHIGEGQGRRL